MEKIIFFSLLIFISCDTPVRLYDCVDEFQRANICEKYKGYSTTILSARKIRIVSKDTSSYVMFRRELGGLVVDEQKNPQGLHLENFLGDLRSLKVIGFQSGKNYCVIYSSWSDSTYLDLKHNNDKFIDNTVEMYSDCVAKECSYRVNFIYTPDIDSIPKTITRNHTVREIQPGWYVFRSYQYSQFDEF